MSDSIVTALVSSIREIQRELCALEATNKELRTENAELADQVARSTSAVEQVDEWRSSVQKLGAELETQRIAMTSRIDELSMMLENANVSIDSYRNDVVKLDAQLGENRFYKTSYFKLIRWMHMHHRNFYLAAKEAELISPADEAHLTA